MNTTTIGLLRREIAKAGKSVMSDVTSGAAYLSGLKLDAIKISIKIMEH